MERRAFLLRVRPGKEEEYKRTHANVWPELIEENRRAGIRNYSIFMHGNLLFGYMEVEDYEKAMEYLGKSEVQRRWQELHADILETEVKLDEAPLTLLEEVFHQEG
ncbi:MAG TPA: L-rhamnose mutarotase [Chloroflexota bacterium]